MLGSRGQLPVFVQRVRLQVRDKSPDEDFDI